MPIRVPEPPDEALEAARRSVARRPEPRGRLRRRPTLRGTPAPALTSPHRVFALGIDALAARQPIEEAAQPTGWRFLVDEDDEPVAAAEVHDETRTTVPAQLTEGPFVGSTVEGMRAAATLPGVGEATFDLRVLRVPALYLVALWLHAPDHADLFVPIDPAPAPFEAGRSYDEAEFVEVASRLAERAAEAERSAERPDELGA